MPENTLSEIKMELELSDQLHYRNRELIGVLSLHKHIQPPHWPLSSGKSVARESTENRFLASECIAT
jgi:hypothetical protein